MTNRTAALLASLTLAAALLPSAVLAWRWRAMPQVGLFHDDAIYVVGAKSLAQQGAYRLDSLPDRPRQTKYPPLYPLLLSAAWLIQPAFPDNLPLVMLLTWAALPVSVLLTRRLLLDAGISNRLATGVAAWSALNPVAVMFSLLAMAELMSLALLLAALILAERASRRDAPHAIALLAGLAGGAAFLTRAAILPLVVSTPAVFVLLRKRRHAAMFLAGMLPAILGWQAWAALRKSPAPDLAALYYSDYLGYYLRDFTWQAIPNLLWLNADAAAKAIGELLIFDDLISFFTLTVARLLTAATVIGAVRLYRHGVLRQYAAFSLLYVLQFLLWNYTPNSRFFLVLLPLLAIAALTEARRLAGIIGGSFHKPRLADRAVAGFATLVLAGAGVYAASRTWYGLGTGIPKILARQRRATDQARPAWRWLEHNTAGDAIVLAYSDPLVFLYTGRRGISFRVPPSLLLRADRAGIERHFAGLPGVISAHGISFLLSTPADYHFDAPRITLPAWRHALAAMEPVFRSGDVVIYRAVKPVQ